MRFQLQSILILRFHCFATAFFVDGVKLAEIERCKTRKMFCHVVVVLAIYRLLFFMQRM